jgi:hypothetical protein
MDASNWLTVAGLAADIVGVYFVWKFGLPERISRTGESAILMEESDYSEIAKAAKYDRWSRYGIALIIGGFLLQILANFL